jgi:hypothetical protein
VRHSFQEPFPLALPGRESAEETREYRRDLEFDSIRTTTGLSEQDRRDMAEISRRRQARAIWSAGLAAIIFVACVGVLAILRGRHLAARSIIEAIEAARAPAAERAAKPASPAPNGAPPSVPPRPADPVQSAPRSSRREG